MDDSSQAMLLPDHAPEPDEERLDYSASEDGVREKEVEFIAEKKREIHEDVCSDASVEGRLGEWSAEQNVLERENC